MCATIALAGIQKLTLLDYPDKTACTVFTRGCNFACPYCQNSALIPFGNNAEDGSEDYCEETFFGFLGSRRGLLDGVCISGGEPLAHTGIFDFVRRIKDMGFDVKIDTNGSYPDRLKELAEPGYADYIAMDIKNTLSKYAQTVGIPGYDTSPVISSMEYLLAGNVPYEFRTTVVRQLHSPDDIISIARLIPGAGKYFLQSFVSSSAIAQSGLDAYSSTEIREILENVKKVLPCTELRGI